MTHVFSKEDGYLRKMDTNKVIFLSFLLTYSAVKLIEHFCVYCQNDNDDK